MIKGSQTINKNHKTINSFDCFYYNNHSPIHSRIIVQMNSISQSKYQNRGPLIAVIKIELDSQNTDRIFLHLKDNDEELAEEFVQKHSLNPLLKKHIFQRIQMSRQAVDKNKIQQAHSQQDAYDNYKNDSFTTPMPKREHLFEQSSHKKQNVAQPDLEQFQQKDPQPYIAYDDSPQQEPNDTFEERYHGSFEHKIFEKTKRQPQKPNIQTDMRPNCHLNEPKRIKDKYKNLYDVSGLKLKSSYPSLSQEPSHQTSSKHPTEEYASSESSQGLFEKQLSNEKPYLSNAEQDFAFGSAQQQPIKDLKRNLSYKGYNETNAFRKQRIPEFQDVDENAKYKPFNPSLYQPQGHSNVWKQSHTNGQIDKLSQNPIHKQFSAISKDNQTKFSSIENVSYTDLMDLNYVSFNQPHSQILSHPQPTKTNHRLKESFQNYEQLSFSNPHEYHHKKIGSIRSNVKHQNDTENSIKSNHYQPTYNHHQFTPHSDAQAPHKFNQQKFFTNIKDIHSIKNLQQNRQLNTEFTRPNVKIYNKQEMKSLKQSYLSKSISKSQLSRINAEVTSRLYNEAEIKKKYLDSIKARAKNQKEEELQQIQQLREKPQINMLSKLLAENRMKENKKLEDYLIDQGKILDLKRQQMSNRQTRKQLQECSFRPQINDESQRLNALQRSRSQSRISNHSEIKCSKRTYYNESTFHPEINKLSNAIAKDKGNFNERQHAFLEEKNSNLFKKMQEQRIKEKTDQTSGQRLFQPQLTQRTLKLAKQSGQKYRQNKPIHSYLYELSKITRKQQKIDQKPSINPESQKLIIELQQKRLNWLFLQLDNDEDGIISSKRICIDQIPTEILQIIAPVLYEMEELNTELNMDDFKNAIKNLNKGLDPYQKSLLYNYNYSAKMIRT